MTNKASEPWEIERMLLWFKAQLPPHELSDWVLDVRPRSRPVERPDSYRAAGDWHRFGDIRGHATCSRCHARFDVPDIGNFGVSDDNQEQIAKAVGRAKEWVGRIAEGAGPCWGDVPSLPVRSCFATLDSTGLGVARA